MLKEVNIFRFSSPSEKNSGGDDSSPKPDIKIKPTDPQEDLAAIQPQDTIQVNIDVADENNPPASLQESTVMLKELLSKNWKVTTWFQTKYVVGEKASEAFLYLITNGSERRALLSHAMLGNPGQFRMRMWERSVSKVEQTEVPVFDIGSGDIHQVIDYSTDVSMDSYDEVLFAQKNGDVKTSVLSVDFLKSLLLHSKLPTPAREGQYPYAFPLLNDGKLVGLASYSLSEPHITSYFDTEEKKEVVSAKNFKEWALNIIREVAAGDKKIRQSISISDSYSVLFVSSDQFHLAANPFPYSPKKDRSDIPSGPIQKIIYKIRKALVTETQRDTQPKRSLHEEQYQNMIDNFTGFIEDVVAVLEKPAEVKPVQVAKNPREVSSREKVEKQKPEQIEITQTRRMSKEKISRVELREFRCKKLVITVKPRDSYDGYLDVVNVTFGCTVKSTEEAPARQFEKGIEALRKQPLCNPKPRFFEGGNSSEWHFKDKPEQLWLDKKGIKNVEVDTVTITYTVAKPSVEHSILLRGSAEELVVNGAAGTKVEIVNTGVSNTITLSSVDTASISGRDIWDLSVNGGHGINSQLNVTSHCHSVTIRNLFASHFKDVVDQVTAENIAQLTASGIEERLDALNSKIDVHFLTSGIYLSDQTVHTCTGVIRIPYTHRYDYAGLNGRLKQEKLKIENY